jgi:signal transduction histidine kinase/CheY-like chemotaxis protein
MEISQPKLTGMVRSGLNLISQAISIHDQDLRLIHANHRFQTLFQLPDNLVQPGSEFADILRYLAVNGEYGSIDNIDEFIEEKVDLARKFVPHYFERTRANGTSISIDGNPLDQGGWISVYTDITEIRQQEAFIRSHAESLSDELVKRSEALARTNRELTATVRALELAKQQLSESRERLALINRMTPAHIAHVDRTGEYTHSNGRLTSIVPHADRDILGRHMAEVLGDEIWTHVGPKFQETQSGRETVTEFKDPRSGRFVRLAMSPDMDETGKIVGAYILSTDATQEVSARNALAHARRRELATQLTSGMAHDFSNLLTIIMGQQERLSSVAQSVPQIGPISETIKSAAKRGAELVSSLNNLSEQRQVNPVSVDLNAFLKGLRPLAQAALPQDFRLQIETDVPHERLVFDPGFAQDALLNLFINAAEACEDAGHISLTIRKVDNELEFLARDNGPGFSQDALHKALSPFFSTKTTKSGKAGRGLGLTSVYDFAKSCGGSVKFGNAVLGGAEVCMRIPYVASTPMRDGLVLLVDDDDDVRSTVRTYLRQRGHIVIEAGSVKEAEKLIAIDGLSCVVSDLDIGNNGTGLDVAKLVPTHLPLMIITGLPRSDTLRQMAERDHLVLEKPFDSDTFGTALDRLFA